MTLKALEALKKGYTVYTNYSLQNLGSFAKNHVRLDEKTMTDFDYWREQFKRKQKFMILIDEFHNYLDARQAMRKKNVGKTQFFAQIRKVLKGHKECHLIISTQLIRQVDVRMRELAHWIIKCRPIKEGLPIILQTWYTQDNDGNYFTHHMKRVDITPSFNFYDTHEIIDFGMHEEEDG